MADQDAVNARESREILILSTGDGVRIRETKGDLSLAVTVTWDELATAYAMKEGKRKSYSCVQFLGESLIDSPIIG